MKNLTIKCEIVSPENIKLAIKTQNKIFPKENGALNLKASADKSLIEEVYGKNQRKSVDFWLCLNEDDVIVGITGIYSYIEYPNDAWCGWFGILPEYQGRGYGKELFNWTMNKAREMGFENFRLYTDLEDNKMAVNLYRKVGMIEEPYLFEDMGDENIIIFSKSLNSNKTIKFGKKNLHLNEQQARQQK